MDEKLRELLFEIKDSLKRIEVLLYESKQNKPAIYYHYYTTIDSSPRCNCGIKTPGSCSGGWFCPLHGQQF